MKKKIVSAYGCKVQCVISKTVQKIEDWGPAAYHQHICPRAALLYLNNAKCSCGSPFQKSKKSFPSYYTTSKQNYQSDEKNVKNGKTPS